MELAIMVVGFLIAGSILGGLITAEVVGRREDAQTVALRIELDALRATQQMSIAAWEARQEMAAEVRRQAYGGS